MVRIVHYLNQFLAGLGGEDRADLPAGMMAGPIGPGRLLAATCGERAAVVATVYCGDNHFAEHEREATERLITWIAEQRPDVLVAGPAFASGRHGLACATVAAAVQQQLGLPAVAGLHPENPGVPIALAGRVHVVPAGTSAADMGVTVPKMATLAMRLGAGEGVGTAAEEGYLPRGFRRNRIEGTTAAERAVEGLLAKLAGRPYATEVPLPTYEPVPVPPPIPDLSRATVALVTEGGIVPRGNPDGLPSARADRWLKYRLDGLSDLLPDAFESIHSGYDTRFAKADPDRVAPLDALRLAEREGRIGRLYPVLYTTTGNVTSVSAASRFGREIASDLKEAGIDAVVLTAT